MTFTIEPYKYNKNIETPGKQIIYWGVYLDDMEISTTTSEEKAIETKEWMENWLEGILQ